MAGSSRSLSKHPCPEWFSEPLRLPGIDHDDLWATLAAAVWAQAEFDRTGFTAKPPIDLRSKDCPVECEGD